MSANFVSVDEESLRKNIMGLVRKTVEETFNALLFIVWGSEEVRRDGRDVTGELVAAVIEGHCFCTLPLSRCFAFSEKPVDIMFLKL